MLLFGRKPGSRSRCERRMRPVQRRIGAQPRSGGHHSAYGGLWSVTHILVVQALDEPQEQAFCALFDRSEHYAELLLAIKEALSTIQKSTEAQGTGLLLSRKYGSNCCSATSCGMRSLTAPRPGCRVP